MLRVLVDSGCSIKSDELEYYNIELIPLKILLGEQEYQDGVDLPLDLFYEKLIKEKIFPKTSLPNLGELEEKVNAYTNAGDRVVILTISAEISGSFNAIKLLFKDNDKVLVLDSRMAVGGMRLIVDEINRYRDADFKTIQEKVEAIIPKIKIMAIPETLEYLMRGGRLSKKEWLIGSILKIKPIIGFIEGKVKVLTKKIGLKSGMNHIASALNELECDENYEIIPSYTYSDENLVKLMDMTDEKYKKQMRVRDNLDPAIACHWGPGAFGYIFVSKK